MLFSSITFLVFFFPVVLLLYYMLPNLIYRNAVLFFSSLLFYAWGEPVYVFLMLASIVFNYNIGLWLGNNTDNYAGGGHRKKLLVLGILINIAILFLFKYLGFTSRIINVFLEGLRIPQLHVLNLIMPIGISFYTFQEISYLVDVYRNPKLAQKSVLNLGLYVAFFPQLIAGPIVRYHDINEQIENRKHSLVQFAVGLERFIIGLSKKVLLANTYASVCDVIYSANFASYGAFVAWVAALAYSLQIYYDFSGYSDMAIGLAKLFGFDLLENFNYPYVATSIKDFWKRWHISLTNFFRDYVYIPLGGNRKGKLRTIVNQYIVFFVTGLWHGAAFNFIFWGLGHGTLMTIENLFSRKTENRQTKLVVFQHILRRIVTLFCVLFLWVLFRTGTKDFIKLLLKMLGVNYTQFTGTFVPLYVDEFMMMLINGRFYFFLFLGCIFAFPWWRKFSHIYENKRFLSIIILFLKYLVLCVLFILCYASLASNSYNPFIYFRF